LEPLHVPRPRLRSRHLLLPHVHRRPRKKR
jgi:hypothetical protein